MQKILVTGGAGFIGSAIAEKLIEDKTSYVVIVDNLLTGNIGKLPKLPKNNWKFIRADVNRYKDIAEIMFAYQFDYVFHYAAVVGVKRTLENPISVLNDIEGIKNLLELSKNTGVKRVFFSSSSEIYGEPVEFPQNEYTTPLNSRLPYAIVKNVGEAYLKSFYQEYGLEYTIFRFFNTYGPKQSINFVISRFIQRALLNHDISIYGDGMQTRTFCFVDDNVAATYNAFVENKFINDVVNIGGADEITIIDLAKTVIKVLNSKSKIIYLPALPEGDMRRRKPDTSRMNELITHKPIELEKGIHKIIEAGLFELNNFES